jgi:hypothetical protein
MISRRSFFARITQAIGLSAVLPLANECAPSPSFTGRIVGPNAALGHRLRSMNFPPVSEFMETDILIVGGGISGLSAARYIKKHTNNFLLLELEENAGGNSIGGSNKVSAFPWGAHYLPLPGNNDHELTSFLVETNVITGYENNLPVFNEYYLCHDPKERLFIHGYWQDGVVPHEGVPQKDRDEIQRFLSMMHDYRELKGIDGYDGFAIPVSQSSQDKKLLELDLVTAAHFLHENNFKSPFLHWYVKYCCADDYGTSLEQTSAWAMIHYFASRKGVAANASADAVLTWPEGNHWLAKELKKTVVNNVLSSHLAYAVHSNNENVDVLFFDAARNVSKKIACKAVIMATPQFINHPLLKDQRRSVDYTQFDYAPWMVANITTDLSLNERRGEHLCWDNVIYGSDGLGYVNAMHQQLGSHYSNKVITYYKPLLAGHDATVRKEAQSKTFQNWKHSIVNDLKNPHPGIEKHIEEMNVWLWGHGMIKPVPGFIWGENRKNAMKSVSNKIFFAHSDLSGISIFEEAFYQGHQAAKAVLGHDA